jgi:hypothetical protein
VSLLASGAVFAAPAIACDLSEPETATIAAIDDGETLTLTDGGSSG